MKGEEAISPLALERAMGALPEEQREAVFLKIWEEMTFTQMGDLLGIPLDTAASRYRYGIAKLKKIVMGYAS